MSPSRRSLLKLGTVASAYGLVPRRLRGWLARNRAPAERGLVEPTAVPEYEEGDDLTLVTPVDGIISIEGAPVYSQGDTVHGSLGWRSPGTGAGGRLSYLNPNPEQSSGSVYVTPRGVPDAPAALVAFSGISLTPAAMVAVRLRPDLRVDVVDAHGTRHALSAPCWLPDHPVRVDWQQVTSGVGTTLTVWLYSGLNAEGWRPDITLTAALPALPLTQVTLGAPATGAAVGLDTYREYGVATMPAPFAPLTGLTAVHTFDGGVDGGAVIAGADSVRSVTGHPTYSATQVLHGPLGVLIPDAPDGAVLAYDIPNPPAHTGSLYVFTAVRGKADSRVVSLRNGGTPLAQIFLRPSGSVCIKDRAGTIRAETAMRVHVATWMRLDWQAVWDGSTLDLAVRVTARYPDAADGYTEIAASVPNSSIPDTLGVGTPIGTWRLYLDTLRTYGDVSAWPSPFDPEPIQVFSLIGDPTPDTMTVSSMALNVPVADLAVSQHEDLTDAVLSGAAPVDADHLVRHTITGLQPATTYHARLMTADGVGFGDPLRFTTLPSTDDSALAMKIALVSCQRSPLVMDPPEPGWQNLLAWDPQLVIHGGDFGYWGGSLTADDPYQKHVTCYRQQIERLPTMRTVLMTRPFVIQVSDHETSNDNGDNFDDPVTVQALLAYQKLMPNCRYGDPRNPIRGRFLAFNLNAHIRVVVIDFRSLDRSPGNDVDGPKKSALGATQMKWLHSELVRPEALKILVSDPAWGPAHPPASPIPYAYLDKWWNYRASQRAIANMVKNNRTVNGGPINVDLWGSDRHLLGYLAGENNVLGGFPVLCGSGMDMHALPLFVGETYDQVFGCGDVSTWRSQYMRIELTDDGAGTITRTATGWDCVTDSAQVTASDTWIY